MAETTQEMTQGQAQTQPAAAATEPPATQTGATTGPAAQGQSAEANAAPVVEPTITVNAGVTVTDAAKETLKKILKAAGLTSATITSGSRTSEDQARAMYQNLVGTGTGQGVAAQKALYGAAGDQVIDVFVASKAAGKDEAGIRADMVAKIVELGPSTVSKHCSDTHDVFDVAPSSISDGTKFSAAIVKAKADGDISNYILPPTDPAYHIEKPK